MANTSWLSTFLHWMFAVFAVLASLFTIALVVLWIIDPRLPADAHFGPRDLHMVNQPGTVELQHSTFTLNLLRGNLSLTVKQADGLIEVVKHHGFPVLFLHGLFSVLLFELLRRLFRNVVRRESFTWQNVRLVQTIGISLIAFSLLSAFAENWFAHAVYSYLADHAVVSISGTPLQMPHGMAHHFRIGWSHSFPFGTPLFFSGLLVLALSEVFRQGMVLKSENDLTV